MSERKYTPSAMLYMIKCLQKRLVNETDAAARTEIESQIQAFQTMYDTAKRQNNEKKR